MQDKIQAIYGVSAGAILASYRAAGYTAKQIFDIFFNARPFGIMSLNLLSKKSVLKTAFFEKIFARDLPKDISDLKKKIYIWTTDLKTGKFILFDKGPIVPILLWSMSIPWIFPMVTYEGHHLMDGGATNNFPVTIAKKRYPKNEIIGIALNKFKNDQRISNLFDALSISFEILLRHNTIVHLDIVDHLFYRDLNLKVLDVSKKHMQEAYAQGYEDCLNYFK